MSYILDALKKVEHEKLKKTAPGSMTSIAGDLFQDRPPLHTGRGRRMTFVAVLVAVMLTLAVSWLMFRPVKRAELPDSAVRNHSTLPLPAVKSIAPVPAPPVPAIPAPAAVAPVERPASATGSEDEEERISSKSGPSRQNAAPAASLSLKAVTVKVPAPADIKLSGIAWQEERGLRRAVVNGFLLKEGALVAGARVTEILADRVRFAKEGSMFELRLELAAIPEVRP